jgi:hypothetical protein
VDEGTWEEEQTQHRLSNKLKSSLQPALMVNEDEELISKLPSVG